MFRRECAGRDVFDPVLGCIRLGFLCQTLRALQIRLATLEVMASGKVVVAQNSGRTPRLSVMEDSFWAMTQAWRERVGTLMVSEKRQKRARQKSAPAFQVFHLGEHCKRNRKRSLVSRLSTWLLIED